jgi:tRNA(fMet)-specific endonuclease VapC
VKYCVDTDWVADFLKGRRPAVELLTSLAPEGLALSVITYGEIYEGIEYGSDPNAHDAVFRRFLRGASVLSITRPVARRFATIRGQLRQRGQLIPQPDLLIAATALHHGLTLVTRNVSDFHRIPGLKLYQSS